MIYRLNDDLQFSKFIEKVQKMIERVKNKETVTVELVEKKPQRTLSQNAYLHVLLAFFACEYGCGLDEAKIRFYKERCNKDIFTSTRVNRKGQTVEYLRSSADLSVDEMRLSIERFMNWSAQIGIPLPDASNHEFLIYAQQQIEANKEFMY